MKLRCQSLLTLLYCHSLTKTLLLTLLIHWAVSKTEAMALVQVLDEELVLELDAALVSALAQESDIVLLEQMQWCHTNQRDFDTHCHNTRNLSSDVMISSHIECKLKIDCKEQFDLESELA